MSPVDNRLAPNHSTATLDTLTVTIAVGNMNAISRPARSAVSVT